MAAHENSSKPGTAQAGLDVARDGWFTELSTMWKGQGLSFQVEKTLFQDRSDFQVRYLASSQPVDCLSLRLQSLLRDFNTLSFAGCVCVSDTGIWQGVGAGW